MLAELAATGMAFNAALKQGLNEIQAAALEPAERRQAVAELSLAYNRVARAVRQTLALEVAIEAGEGKRAAAANENHHYPDEQALKARADQTRAKLWKVLNLPGDPGDHRWSVHDLKDYMDTGNPDRMYGPGGVPDEHIEVVDGQMRLKRPRPVGDTAMAEDDAEDEAEDGEDENSTGPP